MVLAGVYYTVQLTIKVHLEGGGGGPNVPTTIRIGIQKVNQKVSITYCNSILKESANILQKYIKRKCPRYRPLVLLKVPI
jgi:hypothetical protein